MLRKKLPVIHNELGSEEFPEAIIGITIEEKVRRWFENKEPIDESAELIFTERKDGVEPAYNIRTDKWDLACVAMDAVQRDYLAKRNQRIKEKDEQDEKNEKNETDTQNPQT